MRGDGTPRPGAGYNAGGKRTAALARRLRVIRARMAAGEDPYGKPLPALTSGPGRDL